MAVFQTLLLIAYFGATIVILAIAANRHTVRTIPFLVVLTAAFALFTSATIAKEGVIQFWINHSTTMAGNQVWFDLLIAVSISFFLIAPRARAAGMSILPWAIAVLATASLALLPMLARLLWLEQRRG
ncbi:hypothetical protein ACNI3Q_12815 [Sphingomonas sp. FW199]|uniref:hypothetical protein n=1 Tax=Sphingomonas sp. FW199 TaxID=3400217 RepID=UPI003CE9E6AE